MIDPWVGDLEPLHFCYTSVAMLLDELNLDLNPQFMRALELMNNTKEHLFITGNAGTGKSTLLELFRKQTHKKVVVLAPTGVSALNVKGQTVHSFFGFKPNLTLSKVRRAKKEKLALYDNLDAIVIDEISMVRADLLDCVDKALRLNRDAPHLPFGGVQMIFIGDLFQLPPVVTEREQFMFENEYESPYFFSAFAFDELDLKYVELKKIYRQEEKRFVELLNNVRHNQVSAENMQTLENLHNPFYEPDADDVSVCLTTTNKMAGRINDHELKRLLAKEMSFHGSLEGEFGDRRLPAPDQLKIRAGAQVMMVCNDHQRRWANGTIGIIVEIQKSSDPAKPDAILVELQDSRLVCVLPYTWEMFRYVFDEDSGRMETEVTGKYTQYPMILAWAVTIHKSQGKTLENVIIDTGWGTFAHGQMYVALSRCTTLEGMVLKQPFRAKDVILDQRVVNFIKTFN
jgi:ATP-dependent DNA helicase PIF1